MKSTVQAAVLDFHFVSPYRHIIAYVQLSVSWPNRMMLSTHPTTLFVYELHVRHRVEILFPPCFLSIFQFTIIISMSSGTHLVCHFQQREEEEPKGRLLLSCGRSSGGGWRWNCSNFFSRCDTTKCWAWSNVCDLKLNLVVYAHTVPCAYYPLHVQECGSIIDEMHDAGPPMPAKGTGMYKIYRKIEMSSWWRSLIVEVFLYGIYLSFRTFFTRMYLLFIYNILLQYYICYKKYF